MNDLYNFEKFIFVRIFRPKVVKILQYSIFVKASLLTQNHDFWRENSNYLGNPIFRNSQYTLIFS